MRMRLLIPTMAIAITSAGLSVGASADDGASQVPIQSNKAAAAPASPAGSQGRPNARQALARAKAVLSGAAAAQAKPAAPSHEATLALRDLWLTRGSLEGADRRAADRLLARPTDGGGDPQGDGYTVAEAAPRCGTRVCIHYVTSTSDAVPLADANVNGIPDYVEFALTTMESVAANYAGAGYRAPKPDGALGGDARTDIYLTNVGDAALYGYCTSDQPAPPPGVFDVWAYCVLDNDYSAAEFPTNTAPENFQVTAAHEFFHAVQFAYDAAEDGWLMEATATWAEDELYDNVNDNLQYLRDGQLGQPFNSLDRFSNTSLIQYGNWIFFRYLTERFPTKVGAMPSLVRDIWARADSTVPANDLPSIEAVKAALSSRGARFPDEFARFSAINRFSQKLYSEGAANRYPQSPTAYSARLRPNRFTAWTPVRAEAFPGLHLSSVSAVAVPVKVKGTAKLLVQVKLGAASHSPRAVVDQVTPGGRHILRFVRISSSGLGAVKVPFANTKTRQVMVTMVNAGTSYHCWQGTVFSCQGISRDDNQRASFRFTVTRR